MQEKNWCRTVDSFHVLFFAEALPPAFLQHARCAKCPPPPCPPPPQCQPPPPPCPPPPCPPPIYMKPQVQVVRETQSHMDDLPVPRGPWQKYFDERNRKWNIMLASSIAFFGFTLYCVSCMLVHVANSLFLSFLCCLSLTLGNIGGSKVLFKLLAVSLGTSGEAKFFSSCWQ